MPRRMAAMVLLALGAMFVGAAARAETKLPPPVPASAVNDRAVRFQPFMARLDQRGVKYVQGWRNALYVEATRGWLCLWRPSSGLRCYDWPDGGPRPTSLGDWRQDERTLPVGTRDHELDVHLESPGRADESVTFRHVRCAPDQQAAFAYMMPPSRRPKPGTRPCKTEPLSRSPRLALASDATPLEVANAFAAARAAAGDEDLIVESVERDGRGVVSIGTGTSQGGFWEMWTCLRGPGGARACGSTELSSFEALTPDAPLPGGWLLLAYAGAYRSGSNNLVWLTARDGRLITATMNVGATDGEGEGCERYRSYCVDVVGNWTRWELLSPTCVRIGPTVRWQAIHVRAQHRWIKERLLPPARAQPDDADTDEDRPGVATAPGTYQPAGDRWERADCAPARPR